MARLTDRITGETRVYINIHGSNGQGKKITVTEEPTVAELGVTVQAGAAPVYPGQEIAAVMLRQDLTADQKEAESNRLQTAYKKAQAQYAAGGGVSIQNKIAQAVVKLCKTQHGMKEKGNEAWNLTEGNLTVTPQERDGVVFVQVTGAPVWGI